MSRTSHQSERVQGGARGLSSKGLHPAQPGRERQPRAGCASAATTQGCLSQFNQGAHLRRADKTRDDHCRRRRRRRRLWCRVPVCRVSRLVSFGLVQPRLVSFGLVWSRSASPRVVRQAVRQREGCGFHSFFLFVPPPSPPLLIFSSVLFGSVRFDNWLAGRPSSPSQRAHRCACAPAPAPARLRLRLRVPLPNSNRRSKCASSRRSECQARQLLLSFLCACVRVCVLRARARAGHCPTVQLRQAWLGGETWA